MPRGPSAPGPRLATAPRRVQTPARDRWGGVARTHARTPVFSSAPLSAAELQSRLTQINARRVAYGCTQARLARALGVSASTISRLFRGAYNHLHGTHPLASGQGLQRLDLALTLLARATPAPPASSSSRGTRPARTAPPRLPRPSREERPQRALAASAKPRYRVLLAEDDAATLELYRMVLAEDDSASYVIEVATSGAECVAALARARSGPPLDLLVMDLGLADGRSEPGTESLLARLLAHRELLPSHLLIVSGISPYQLRQRRPQLQALGATFLSKPFDVRILLQIVHALCAEQPVPAPARVYTASLPV